MDIEITIPQLKGLVAYIMPRQSFISYKNVVKPIRLMFSLYSVIPLHKPLWDFQRNMISVSFFGS